MAKASKNDYPIPKFHFQVDFAGPDAGKFTIGFSEVSGLDFETEVIEYRDGTDPLFRKGKTTRHEKI